ncbi:MAG TPA: hypothetical protein VGJ75_01895 [Dongiaceae bacterium]
MFAIGFAAKLIAMATWTFRRVYMLMLGLLLALGMSLSVVQAGAMAAGMAMSAQQMSANGMGDCSSCKDSPGGAKSMVCDAACTAAVIATMPQLAVLMIRLPAEHPLFQSSMLSGWTASPNPHPPKRVALI